LQGGPHDPHLLGLGFNLLKISVASVCAGDHVGKVETPKTIQHKIEAPVANHLNSFGADGEE